MFLGYLTAMKTGEERNSKAKAKAGNTGVSISATVEGEFTDLFLGTDESYQASLTLTFLTLDLTLTFQLIVTTAPGGNVDVEIASSTYYGFRHALETLSQMITWNSFTGRFQIYSEVN